MMKHQESYSGKIISGNEDTVKISTIVFFVLGLIIPLWVITLPICWFLAYRSFKSGDGSPVSKPQVALQREIVIEEQGPSKFDNIEKLKSLLDSGALTEEEFLSEKSKILNQ